MLMMELINVLAAAAVTPSKTNYSQVAGVIQGGALAFGTDSGVANAYIVTMRQPTPALIDGQLVTFRAVNANTGATTMEVYGLTPQPVIGLSDLPLQGGEIITSGMVSMRWSASQTSWILVATAGGSLAIPGGTQTNHAVTVAQLNALSAAITAAYIAADMVVAANAASALSAADTALTAAYVAADVVVAGNAATALAAETASRVLECAQLGWYGQEQALTGAGNFTVPAGVYKIRHRTRGAGGTGGGSSAGNGGGSGGGGDYEEGVIATTPGTVIAYSVGVGVAGTTGNGSPGGNTTFGSITAGGGLGGTAGSGVTSGSAGAGGTGTGGTVSLPGGSGGVTTQTATGSGTYLQACGGISFGGASFIQLNGISSAGSNGQMPGCGGNGGVLGGVGGQGGNGSLIVEW
ncbi:hypothetical protein B0E46_15895 [Rhodanobacter sp. B04]|nr:hypothetical protein B0E46_15895 [Rhodanobacter sp. B04]